MELTSLRGSKKLKVFRNNCKIHSHNIITKSGNFLVIPRFTKKNKTACVNTSYYIHVSTHKLTTRVLGTKKTTF